MAAMTPLRFALIGAAGFVAPRHMQAIKDVGGELVAALDPHDAVGVLDRYGWRDTQFFTDEHRFERFLEKLRRDGEGIDWLSVCSPNYMHDTHIRLGRHLDAAVLCEKPLVLDPANLDRLENGHPADPHVFTVLQLRHVEKLKELRRLATFAWKHSDDRSHVKLTYVTPRGRWYHQSWKGDEDKSGGIITNIGIHMLDMLLWIWGRPPAEPMFDQVDFFDEDESSFAGKIHLEQAVVEFELSIDPRRAAKRKLVVGDTEIDFTTGFESLHTTVYRETLAGRGHTIEDARPAIELAWKLRHR